MPPWPPAFGLPAAGFAAACLSCRDGFPPAAASGIQPGSFLPVAFFPVDFFGPSRFVAGLPFPAPVRSDEHTSELQSLMRISYAVFCLKKKTNITKHSTHQVCSYLIHR